MPSAAPISGVGVVRVETVSLGGTVKERVRAARRGLICSGVQGVADGEADIFVQFWRMCWGARDTGSQGVG